MANSFPVSQAIGGALGLLEANSVLGKRVHRDSEKHFGGGTGATVQVRIPKTISATNGMGQNTVYTDINESTVPVEITAEAYSAVALTDQEMALNVIDFGKQVLQPQASGVAKFCEQAIAGVMNTAVTDSTLEISPTNPLGAFVRAAAEFTRREIDLPGRTMAIGPDVLEVLLALPALQDVAASGGGDVLEGGFLTKLLGFDIVVSPYVSGAVAFTPEGFALATRAPGVPEGAGYAATETHNGWSMRYLQDFDITRRAEVSLMSVFVGATLLDERRVMAFSLPSGV
ncbi:P22 phage major capsid protein family protein [Nocardiopsis eucommiae]|uniref:P22 phage major capsid protein family protein n=1 Tax=Nocardiopsis eucommiae TaxID=2831970 RepID=UPI003D70D20A